MRVQQERLIVITCCCDVERNNIVDKEMQRKDRNKTLQVFRVTTPTDKEAVLKFIIRFQKSGDVAFEFQFKEITQVISERASMGIFTLILNKDSSGVAGTVNKSLLQRNVPIGASTF